MMKKIFNMTFVALLAISAVSCTPDREPVFSPENAVPSVLDPLENTCYILSEDNETFIDLTFTPADFGISVAKSYTAYADLAGNNFASQKSLGTLVGSPDAEKETVKVSSVTLNQALIGLGCVPEDTVEVEVRIQAEIMGESSSVSGTAILSNTVVFKAVPYSTEKVWPRIHVVGDFNGWTFDHTYLFSYAEDEENYVGVVDFGEEHDALLDGDKKKGFKLSGSLNWENGNWGAGSMTSDEADAASITLWDDGGSQNITNYTAYRYYNFHFVKSSLTLNMVKGFDCVGIIGLNGDWDNDIVMTCNHISGIFYADIEVSAATEFKFRLDKDWGVNWGNTVEDLVPAGDNIKIEQGNYRVYLDLNDWDNPKAELSTEDYGTQVE